MSAPRVSLCIPAYQAAAHLGTTLRSALAQDYDDLEIVVLDNASTDATVDIVAGFPDPRLRLETNEQTLPLPDNWNRAVSLCRGPLIKLVCADDLVHPNAVRIQAEILAADDTIALVASRRHLVDDEGRIVAANRGLHGLFGRHPGRELVSRVVRSGANPVGEPGGVMFRRRDFDAVGGFHGELLFPMDLDLWIRLAACGDFVGIETALAAFRASTGSVSSQLSRRQYLEQQELTRRLASDPRWQVRTRDVLMGRAQAPLARLRRQLFFRIAGWSHRTPLSTGQLTGDTGWLTALQESVLDPSLPQGDGPA